MSHQADQLPLDLPTRTALGRDAFFVADPNAEAVAWIDGWPAQWRAPWLAVHGPAGAGKTHLAHIWAGRSGARLLPLSDLTSDTVPDALTGGAVVLDAPHRPGPDTIDEIALFHLINLAREDGAHVLITARLAPSAWPVENEHLRSRLRAMPACSLGPPDDRLLAAVLAKLFADRQLTVSAALIGYLASRMERSFAAAASIVDRLDKYALSRKRRISRALAAEALGWRPDGPGGESAAL